jgi:antitoxin (DNA-binding transcriptional repressor) of toxin-antitoxin stability system
MKAMKLPKEIESFLDAAEATGEETLVFTRKQRPVAALVSLRRVDRESLALSTNPQFLKIIDRARKEVRAGKTISLEALETKHSAKAPSKKLTRTRRARGLAKKS